MDNIIGVGGIVATVLVGIITCIITWIIAKRSEKKQKINYEVRIVRLLSEKIRNHTNDITIYHKDELLVDPCILEVNIINSGNVAICDPPISIKAIGTTYVIPGYFEDVPSGYDELWSIERADAEECRLYLEHINPKQVVKARFYLDEYPSKDIEVICPMPDLEMKKVDDEMKSVLVKSFFLAMRISSGL